MQRPGLNGCLRDGTWAEFLDKDTNYPYPGHHRAKCFTCKISLGSQVHGHTIRVWHSQRSRWDLEKLCKLLMDWAVGRVGRRMMELFRFRSSDLSSGSCCWIMMFLWVDSLVCSVMDLRCENKGSCSISIRRNLQAKTSCTHLSEWERAQRSELHDCPRLEVKDKHSVFKPS